MRDAGFDGSFRDCLAKDGTGGHPTCETFPPTMSERDKVQGLVNERKIYGPKRN
jgi:hypothetical protein